MPVITAVTEFRIMIIIIILVVVVVVVVVVVAAAAAVANLICDRSSKIKLNKLLRNLSNNRTF
jgi:flagellar basal body-associated protein FliL